MKIAQRFDSLTPKSVELRKSLNSLEHSDETSSHFREGQPFSVHDVTAGAESEFQVVVVGDRSDVDLPRIIAESKYFANLVRQSHAEETPNRAVRRLRNFLENHSGHWENSWIRVRLALLSPYAREILDHDLLADKQNPNAGRRSDVDQFIRTNDVGEPLLRIPVSYALKLALADVLGQTSDLPPQIRATGEQLLNHFLNDNLSPETFSFYVAKSGPGRSIGENLARESAIRFLLTQLLVAWMNQQWQLQSDGQRVVVFNASHPPVHQQQLSGLLSDTFYREVCTNPCLSGWDRGEAKQDYMRLCHQILSRSRLNAIGKLKESSVIATDLIVMPRLSDVSLSNNGMHVSLGSESLGNLRKTRQNGFDAGEEKRVGDLATKMIEHFLPLFVGTYSASPYRIDFSDFHAESVLGFLPHQLHPTHLRMIWRRWRKKARNKLFGQPLSPSGFRWFDNLLANLLRLRGDTVTDYRLIDYFVAPLSTPESPALDGNLDNTARLKRDLTELGIFDSRMPLYALYRQRMFDEMGYAGFEGRQHSVFPTWKDSARAVDLQCLITGMAVRLAMDGQLTHADIPDTPFSESERRQVVFGSALALPTFFVRQDTENGFLHELLAGTKNTRQSRRYPGFTRVKHADFRHALVRYLREHGAGILAKDRFENLLDDLEHRLQSPQHSAVGRITNDVLAAAKKRSSLQMSAREFNEALENYYREHLRKEQLSDAVDLLASEWQTKTFRGADLNRTVGQLGLGIRQPSPYLASKKKAIRDEQLGLDDLKTVIHLVLLSVSQLTTAFTSAEQTSDATPIY